ncbi:hypothetical protein ST201phi2-1p090 [Pseudomonas phage 201phi2-1]|uniref:Uncharacterized protein n=1 Tax=Pseudomonas phage 201phi2-1 TaxID=198110 RepID=B3FIV4_BP201|nr:hypothetical protein ST201phi2-1p090 [Pseudomonas phage 201phi2-1]ABY62923.1 hypothetical protein 201phi2-1p090 [Pseudomonas phage 201phi2-1]
MTQLSIWRLSLKSLVNGGRRGGIHVIVVVAENEAVARTLASECSTSDHGHHQILQQYLDPAKTHCKLIGYALPESAEGVMAVDYDYDYDHVKYTWVKDDN